MVVGGTKCQCGKCISHFKSVAVTDAIVKVERGGIYARRLAKWL